MIIRAHAKINLSLNVQGKRDDGYHNLESIMLPLEMHDSVEVYINKNHAKDDFVTCDDYSLKITKYNLVHKIIDAAREKYGFKDRFIVNIHKNIFLQAGLGGGSADAGAALRAILKLEGITPTNEELIDIGIKVGSDVPWAIFDKPTLLRRKGDILEFFDHVAPFYVLLVKPLDGCSTQQIFQISDEMPELEHGDINKVLDLYLNDDIKGLGDAVFNSLQKPAISVVNEIETVINSLKQDGFDCVLMSGSGSCVYALTNDKKIWKKSEIHYAKKGYQVCATKFYRGDKK